MGNVGYDPSKDAVVKEILEGAPPAAPYIEAERKTLTDGGGVINPTIKGPRPMVRPKPNRRRGPFSRLAKPFFLSYFPARRGRQQQGGG